MRRILILILAVFLVNAAASGQEEAVARYDRAIEAGVEAREEFEIDAAFAHFLVALEAAESFGEKDWRLVKVLGHLAECCPEAAACSSAKGKDWLDRALRLRAGAIGAIGAGEEAAGVLDVLAEAATGAERYTEAVAVYREALEVREAVHGARHRSVATTEAALAWVYQYLNKPELAKETIGRAKGRIGGSTAEDLEDRARLMEEAARLYNFMDEEAEAAKEFERAIGIYEGLWGEADPRFIGALERVARVTRWWEDAALAERLLARIVRIQLKAHTRASEAYYDALSGQADFYDRKDRWEEAEATTVAALEVLALLGRNDLETAECVARLARVRMKMGEYPEAIEAGERNLAIRMELATAEKSDVTSAHELLALIHGHTGDVEAARGHYDAVDAATRRVQPKRLAKLSDELGRIYSEQGQYAQAAGMIETALAIHEADPGEARSLQAGRMRQLAQVYRAMGRTEDATRFEGMAAQAEMEGVFRGVGERGEWKYFLLGMALFAGFFALMAAVAGVLWHFTSRSVDRALEPLFAPPAAGAVAAGMEAGEPAGLFDLDTGAPVAAEPPPPPPLPVHQYRFLGDGGTLFEIRVRNLLLSLLTLGIYSFWGKARVRRYLCGQIELLEDRFVFHGTGRELLMGWLKAVPVLGFIVLFPNVLPLFWQTPEALLAGQLAVFAAILLLVPVASAGAYRYRLNRMSWRGIRFSFRGSTFRFVLVYVGGYLLLVLSLGLYSPFLHARIERYLLNHSWFGDTRFAFDGHGRHLVLAFLCAGPLTLLSFGLFWPWYAALRSRYCWAHTTVAGARFRCTATGAGLLGLWTGNFLLIVGTLGFGISWATARTLRYWANHLELSGGLALEAIRQDELAASAVGESFADFLGFDFGV
jgi:uncharacterized membrane protein YjgN (DUF898 family)/tetratricopeptide (TPR) repeat protein